jgi:tetratricopeptide (TPR) repeat protein
LALLLAVLTATAQNIVVEAGAGGSLGTKRPEQDTGTVSSPGNLIDTFSGKPPAQTTDKPAGLSQVTVLMREAVRLTIEHKFAEAEERLQKAEALDGNNPDVLNAWVAVLSEQGKFEAAREYAGRNITLAPESFVPRYNYAELFLMEKRYAEARDAFQKVLEKFPESELVWLKLLLIGLLDKKPEDVKSSLNRFAATPPSECSYFAAAAVAFSEGDLIGGKQWLQNCFRDFGTGQKVYLLYKGFADLDWVLLKDYPGLVAH